MLQPPARTLTRRSALGAPISWQMAASPWLRQVALHAGQLIRGDLQDHARLLGK